MLLSCWTNSSCFSTDGSFVEAMSNQYNAYIILPSLNMNIWFILDIKHSIWYWYIIILWCPKFPQLWIFFFILDFLFANSCSFFFFVALWHNIIFITKKGSMNLTLIFISDLFNLFFLTKCAPNLYKM